MYVIKTDKDGNPILDASGKPVMIEVPDAFGEANGAAKFLSAEEAEKRVRAERSKIQKQLEEEQSSRARLEAQLEERDRREKERQLQALPPDQQVLSRMSDLEKELAATRAASERDRMRAEQQIRQVGLVAYRERALRDVPAEVEGLVNGRDEEEIDRAVDAARTAYEAIENRVRARLAAEIPRYAQPVPPPPEMDPNQSAFRGYQPPPNPAYVPPIPQQYVAQAGFPTATNPPQIPDAGEGDASVVSDMTSEQAVRSGRYGGEVRERIHAAIRNNAKYPGTLGSAPRHWSAPQPAGHAAMPGGVMQPQGTPMGPVQHPGMPQHQYAAPQYAPPAPAPAPVDPVRAAALAAIERTQAGQNAIVNGDGVSRTALADAQNYAQQRGISGPSEAFQTRFTHTPPIVPQ